METEAESLLELLVGIEGLALLVKGAERLLEPLPAAPERLCEVEMGIVRLF